jgi:hypothetical protein
MTIVANSTGVFATLNYNFNDPNGAVKEYSANTQAHLNTMPAFIESWQAQDIANNDVGGYFQNPVANVTQSIWTVANTIIAIPNLNQVANLANISSSANSLLFSKFT